MLDSFDSYLRSIGYGGIFALSMLTGLLLATVMFAAIWWFNRPPRRNSDAQRR